MKEHERAAIEKAERLDYTPEGLRERIRKAIVRADEDHPGRLALRGRC